MEYVYAAMLLHSFGKEITEESMKSVVSATGTHPDEAQIKAVVSALKGVDIEKVISEAQTAAVAAPAAAPVAQHHESKKEEKKEEPKAEEAAAGLSSLFG